MDRSRSSRRLRPRSSRDALPLIVLIAEEPKPGGVKKHLFPILHAREAADLYGALLQDTIEVIEDGGFECVVAFTPATARRAFEQIVGRRHRLIAQGPGDLGARLTNVVGQLLSEGDRPLLIVDCDGPGLTPAALHRATGDLGRADVVLGPALDGGYYLLGLSRPHPKVFEDIPWCTDRVLEETRERIELEGLACSLLEPMRGLETPEDLYEWYVTARGERVGGGYPRTWRFLHAILPPRRLSKLEAIVSGEHER